MLCLLFQLVGRAHRHTLGQLDVEQMLTGQCRLGLIARYHLNQLLGFDFVIGGSQLEIGTVLLQLRQAIPVSAVVAHV